MDMSTTTYPSLDDLNESIKVHQPDTSLNYLNDFDFEQDRDAGANRKYGSNATAPPSGKEYNIISDSHGATARRSLSNILAREIAHQKVKTAGIIINITNSNYKLIQIQI